MNADISYSWNYWPYQSGARHIAIVKPEVQYDFHRYDQVNTLLHLHEEFANGANGSMMVPLLPSVPNSWSLISTIPMLLI